MNERKKKFAVLLLILDGLTCFAAALPRPPYAVDGPLASPRIFAEGIISTRDDEFGGTFTPDGRSFYFTKQTQNTLGGKIRVICVSNFKNGKWAAPEVAVFSGLYFDYSPAISPDGSKLFFASNRPVSGSAPKKDTDIWVVDKTATGWGEPKNLGAPVNTGANEANPSATRDGTLYFSSARKTGKGSADIYRSRLIDGKYTEPELLGDAVNTQYYESQPFIAPDESFLVFASIRPDTRQESGEPYGRADLYISFRKNGDWTPARNLGPVINTGANEGYPMVSPDGKYFFFTSERNFTSIPMPRLLTYREFESKLHSTGNGLGDIYQIDIGALGIKPE